MLADSPQTRLRLGSVHHAPSVTVKNTVFHCARGIFAMTLSCIVIVAEFAMHATWGQHESVTPVLQATLV